MLLAGLVAAGCHEEATGPEGGIDVQRQALVAAFSPGTTTPDINEGDTANVNLNVLCVDSTGMGNDGLVDINVNWGDGTMPTTLQLAVGPQDNTGAVCPTPGDFVVCDINNTLALPPGTLDAGCNNIQHPYADNGPGANDSWTVTVQATHPAASAQTSTQNLPISVRNVAPNIQNLVRNRGAFEGVNGEFVATVEDPGLRSDEISEVTYSWTPDTAVNDPTSVTCTCADYRVAMPPPIPPGCEICTEEAAPVDGIIERIYLDNGDYTLTMTVTDKDGLTSTETLDTTIANRVPENLDFTVGGNPVSPNIMARTPLIEGRTYAFNGQLTDPGIDALTIAWDYGDTNFLNGTAEITKASYPALTTLAPANILTPDHTWDDDNDANPASVPYNIVLLANDDDTGSNSTTRYIDIQDVDPNITAFTANGLLANVSVEENQSVTFSVTAISGADDPSFDEIDGTKYAWKIGGNPIPPAGVPGQYSISSGCTNTDTTCELLFLDDDPVQGMPLPAYSVTVDVGDEDSVVTSPAREVTVTNDEPVLDTPILAETSISEGGTASLTVSFSDEANTLDGVYDLLVDWGDGSMTTSATLPGAGSFPAQTHVYEDNKDCGPMGVCSIDVLLCEAGGVACDLTSTNIQINNTNPIPVINAPIANTVLVEGVPFALDGEYSDAGLGKDDIYSWSWGGVEGMPLTGLSVYASRLTDADVAMAPPFVTVGNDGLATTLTFTVTDFDGGSDTTSVDVTVRDNAPTLTITGTSLDNGNDEPATPTIDLSVSAETDADRLTSVVIDWGDGSPPQTDNSIATTGQAGTTVSVTKPAVYADSGTYTVTVTLNDEDSSVQQTTTITVDNVAPEITQVITSPPAPPVGNLIVSEGQSVNVRVLARDVSEPDARNLTVEFDWKDGTSDVRTASQTAPGSNDTVTTIGHQFTGPGVYAVEITVRDKDGDLDTSTVTIEVLNRAPTITDTFNTGPVGENTQVTAVALVENPGEDTLRYSFNFNCTAANLGAVVDGDFGEPRPGTGTSATAQNTYPQNGTNAVCVRVCDDDAQPNSCSYGFTSVQVDNVAPLLTTFPAPAPVDEASGGVSVALTATGSDQGPMDTLSFAFDCTDDGTAEATVTGSPANTNCSYTNSGVYTARVTLTDGDGGEATRTALVRVRNLAPTGVNVVATGALEGQPSTFAVSATDPGGDAITYQFDHNDDGVFDQTNGDGQFAHVYATAGTYQVRARACDAEGACSADATATVTVGNVTPVIADVFNTGPILEGEETTAVVLVDNPSSDTLRYSFNFECTKATAGAVVDGDFTDALPGSGTSSTARNTYAQNGTFNVCVRVCDDDGAADSCAYGVTPVTVENAAPRIGNIPAPAPVNESAAGAVVSLNVSATDAGTQDTHTTTVDCQDDGSIDDSQAGATVTVSCVYANSGVYTARVTVTDSDGASDSRTVVVRVTNVAPTGVTATIPPTNEGSSSSITVAATDVTGDAITYEVDVDNDGTFDLTNPSGLFSFRFPGDGDRTVTVRACDAEGACSPPVSETASVSNLPPVLQNVTVASTATRGAPINVSATAVDPGGDRLRYTFVFRTAGTTVATVGPQTSNTTSLSFNDSGTYTVDVTVEDEAGAPNSPLTDTSTATFTVTDINVLVSAGANPSAPNEGQQTTITVSPQGTAPYTIDYDLNGDGDFDDAGDVRGATCNGTTTLCTQTVTYDNNRPNDAPVRVTVVVEDADTNVASTTVNINVRNVAPTLAPVADRTIAEQATLSLNLSANDPGTQDTLSYALVSGPAGVAVDATSGQVTWTPGYEDEGTTPISVSVSDSDGATTSLTFNVTVTIIDTNNNSISDTRERELNGGNLLPANAGTTDSDNDGVTDLDEILAGTDANTSDAPTAPLVLAPNEEEVSVARPTLTVVNATSPRNRDLTYTFVVVDSQGAEVTRITGVAETATATEAVVDVDLTEDETYRWYAFANDGLADGAESDRGEFVVDAVNVAPPAPDALTPEDAAMYNFPAQPGLEVRAVQDPDGDDVFYIFELADSDQFDNLLETSAARSVPFYSVATELPMGTYYWRAKATDGTNESDYSAPRSFSVSKEEIMQPNRPPTEPEIVSPTGDVTSTSATLEISAATDPDGDQVQYEFEIATNGAFANAQTSGAQVELTWTASNLDEDTIYYWRARATDGNVPSAWVSASFVVNAENGAPTGLRLLNPTAGALVKVAPTALEALAAIDPDGDALTYNFELALDADFTDVRDSGAGVVTDDLVTYTPTPDLFFPGDSIWWRVTVSDGTNEVTVSGQFDIFKEQEIPEQTGGCCSTVNHNNGQDQRTALGALALLGLLGLRRRRRD